jgi:hypothetical protein
MDRVRRGEHDLTRIPDPLRQLLAECLDADPQKRPKLDATLGWLRPQVAPAPRPVPPAPEKLTMPYAVAVAHTSPDALATDVLGTGPQVGADGTRMLTEHQTVLDRPAQPAARQPAPVVHGTPPLGERTRRATLLVVMALLCGGIVAVAPWYGSLALVLLVWGLRSGSMAATAAAERRRTRGPKWYDGTLVVGRMPWELLRSLAGTVLLVLWSAGLALAAGLLCYAFTAGTALTLFVCGAVFAASAWTGPGGTRVRLPVSRVVNPVCRRWKPWLAVTFVLLVLAFGLGGLAQTRGPSWAPADNRPFSGPSTGQPSQTVAAWQS